MTYAMKWNCKGIINLFLWEFTLIICSNTHAQQFQYIGNWHGGRNYEVEGGNRCGACYPIPTSYENGQTPHWSRCLHAYIHGGATSSSNFVNCLFNLICQYFFPLFALIGKNIR